jgi:mRNA interferase HigB
VVDCAKDISESDLVKINSPILGTFSYFCKTYLVRVIAKKILREFWEAHTDCEEQLKSWYQEASNAVWLDTNQIKLEYPSASILPGNRVVFNIKGNHYRLIVKINYDYQMIWIRFIGTHAEYDKINAKKI